MMSSMRNRFILLVSIIYAVLALVWIFMSDQLLSGFTDIGSILWLSTAKGVLFVVVSTTGFYFALRAVPPEETAGAERSLLDSLVSKISPGRVSPWLSYSFALVLTLVTSVVGLAIEFGDDRPLLILFMFPIIFSATLGGFGPGLVSTVVAALMGNYYTIQPLNTFHITDSHDLLQWSFLIVNGIAVSALSEVLRRSLAKAELNRHLLDAVVSGTPDAIFVKDTQGRYLLANAATANYVGKTPGEIIGHDDSFLFPTASAQELMGLDRAIMVAGQTRTHEEQLSTVDGKVIVFLSTKGPLLNAAGQVIGLFGISREITDRKQAEIEHLAKLHFFKSMDTVNQVIQGAHDLQQMMRDVLDAVLASFDCDRAFLMSPCDPEASSWQIAMERNKPEYPGVRAAGVEVPMDAAVARTLRELLASDLPVKFGPDTEPPLSEEMARQFGYRSCMSIAIHPKASKPWQFGIHQCAYAREWTADEEKLLREIGRRLTDALTSLLSYRELQESEAKYRRIVNTAREGIWALGADTLTASVNARMAEMLGYSTEEMTARPVTDFMFEEDIPDHLKRIEVRRQGLPETYERRFRRKNGETLWTLISASAILDEEHRFVGTCAMISDITERKQAEAEILQLNQELEQRVAERTIQLEAANKELEAFAYSVSHDLRAPLRHIDGFLGLLKDNMATVPDEQSQHYMDTISKAARRMGVLIDDLLSFSRMGRQEITNVDVDMGLLVQDVIHEFEPETERRSINWRVAKLPVVTGDHAMLRIVLVNLISNALKFTGPRAQAEIVIGCLPDQVTETVVFVRDNGVGFDMQYAGKLFGVFERLHGVEEFEGTGIGLANVRRVISRHAGRTWAEGKVDGGATFYFSLPHAASNGAAQ